MGKKWPIKPDIVLEGGNIGYNKETSSLKGWIYDPCISNLKALNKEVDLLCDSNNNV